MQEKQFILTTPEQIENTFKQVLKTQLDDLKKNFQPKEPPEYLTRNEVAAMLKIDLSTVHNWTKKGKLKSLGLGGRIYYKLKDIEEALIKIN